MLREPSGASDTIVSSGGGIAAVADLAPPAPAQRRHRVTDPVIVLAARRANGPAKRALDFFASAAGLVFLAPLLLTVAILIKLHDGGPALFGHKRAGRYSKPFRCWKFRTMHVNAAEILERHIAENPVAAAEWRATQKLMDDPRVTAIGRFLRATSIDELPQLVNILLGEMSIVGPRPVPKKELDERYAADRRYYLLVRPGLTGLWQVSGRSNTTYERRVALDRQYIVNWSFVRDLEIMLRTVPAVLKSEGAR
ncbi:MAG: sugar transferase [Hyphomonadaceae bacterium]